MSTLLTLKEEKRIGTAVSYEVAKKSIESFKKGLKYADITKPFLTQSLEPQNLYLINIYNTSYFLYKDIILFKRNYLNSNHKRQEQVTNDYR